jgi:hypothetical protein
MKTGKRPVEQAGVMAAILVLATVLAAPTSLYAQSDDDKMMDDSVMKDKGAMMESSNLLRGSISNVQLDSDGEPEWIQSGFWVLKTRGDSASFVARMTMVRPDGTSLHMHTITNLSVTEQSAEGSTHSIEGTANVMMSNGNVQDVPVTIRVMNNAAIAIWIGPEGVDGHFGTEPIYGTVHQSRAMMEGGAMMEKPVKLTDTNLPVTIPLTRGFADGSEVFYISTEASDKGLAGHLASSPTLSTRSLAIPHTARSGESTW